MKKAVFCFPPYFYKSGTNLKNLIFYLKKQDYSIIYVNTFRSTNDDISCYDDVHYLFEYESVKPYIKLREDLYPKILFHNWLCKNESEDFYWKNKAIRDDTLKRYNSILFLLNKLNPDLIFVNQLGERISRLVYIAAKTLYIPIIMVETGFLNNTFILDPISMHFFRNSYFHKLRESFKGDKYSFDIAKQLAHIYKCSLKTKWDNHNPSKYNMDCVENLRSQYENYFLFFGQTPWDANITFIYDNPIPYKKLFLQYDNCVFKPHPTALSDDIGYVEFLKSVCSKYLIVGNNDPFYTFSENLKAVSFFDCILGFKKFFTISSNSFNDLLLFRFLDGFEWCSCKYSIFEKFCVCDCDDLKFVSINWNDEIFAHLKAVYYYYCLPVDDDCVFSSLYPVDFVSERLDAVKSVAYLSRMDDVDLPVNETFYWKKFIGEKG